MIPCLWGPSEVSATPQPHVPWGQTLTSLLIPLCQRFTFHRWGTQRTFRYSPFPCGSWVPFLDKNTFPGQCSHSREHLAAGSKISWVGWHNSAHTFFLHKGNRNTHPFLTPRSTGGVAYCLIVETDFLNCAEKETEFGEVFKPPSFLIARDGGDGNPAEGTTNQKEKKEICRRIINARTGMSEDCLLVRWILPLRKYSLPIEDLNKINAFSVCMQQI